MFLNVKAVTTLTFNINIIKKNNKKVNLMMKKLEDEYISRLNRNSINQNHLKKLFSLERLS